jgi:hypothetical protein
MKLRYNIKKETQLISLLWSIEYKVKPIDPMDIMSRAFLSRFSRIDYPIL